jgi:hypothetical protein
VPIAAERRAKKQAKKERKAALVAEAQAKGYVKKEWTESMEKLYAKYKDGEERLAKAKAEYDKFRNKFDPKGNSMSKDDHKHAADLANYWEKEAERYKSTTASTVQPHYWNHCMMLTLFFPRRPAPPVSAKCSSTTTQTPTPSQTTLTTRSQSPIANALSRGSKRLTAASQTPRLMPEPDYR